MLPKSQLNVKEDPVELNYFYSTHLVYNIQIGSAASSEY